VRGSRKCEINKQTRCRARHGNGYEYSNEVNIYGKLMEFFMRVSEFFILEKVKGQKLNYSWGHFWIISDW
jgi:hypothetical protein